MFKKFSRRDIAFLKSLEFNDEDVQTVTSIEQKNVEKQILANYEKSFDMKHSSNKVPDIFRHKHTLYLTQSLCHLSKGYEVLDSSRTWICYWTLHALSLLDIKIPDKVKTSVIQFISRCQNSTGGFGGGPGQLSHLATTYAAVNALTIIGTEEAYNAINRQTLLEFLWSVKQKNGSFCMHYDGEVDIRSVYCALSVASITNILSEKLCESTAQWIMGCQTYEGGFGGTPGMEAHGGYTFCGFASLVILDKVHLCDIKSLLRWLVNKQMKLEGGFQGRTNKLVDGCYSFWQGGCFPLLQDALEKPPKNYLFNNGALQEYILNCCQYHKGGLIDKPGKDRDEYHSCYVLSGLSLAQHFKSEVQILGSSKNEVASTHPLYNIRVDLIRKAILYFQEKTGDPEEKACSIY